MREAFYEESAVSARSQSEVKLYTLFKVLAIIFFVAGGLLATFAATIVQGALDQTSGLGLAFALIEYFGLIALLIGVGLAFWFLKNRFNVSYDYTFVEDELRITKVFNGRRRKHIIALKADHILQVGWVESDAFERQLSGMQGKKPKVMSSNREPMEGKELYYILYSTTMEKSLYVIEARQSMLEYLVRAVGRNKLERK